jgi:hypothetical protein
MDEYRFEMVPWATFCALYRAPSIGRAFNIQIRPIFTGIKHEESS